MAFSKTQDAFNYDKVNIMGAINIIFADSSDTPNLIFVDVENDNGEGIQIGEWVEDEKYTRLRITLEDIVGVVISECKKEN